MRTYSTVKIYPIDNDIETAKTAIISACSDIIDFYYDEDKSILYEKAMSTPSCIVVRLIDGPPLAALAFSTNTTKTGNLFLELKNIVPAPSLPSLSLKSYNEVVPAFIQKFRPLLRIHGVNVKLIKPGNLTLQNIITGEYCRTLFQDYIINQNIVWDNFSYHQGTTDYLDAFIVSINRYRGMVDIDALYIFMIEVVGWNENNARWVRHRIETVLDFLDRRHRPFKGHKKIRPTNNKGSTKKNGH